MREFASNCINAAIFGAVIGMMTGLVAVAVSLLS